MTPDPASDSSAQAPRPDTLAPYKSKTLAAWLALLVGTMGLHRLYLYGLKDVWGWLHPLPSALGLLGVASAFNRQRALRVAPAAS
jgi:hypothetical protein